MPIAAGTVGGTTRPYFSLCALIAASVGLLACGPIDPSDPDLGAGHAEIVNGETDEGDPAVVALTVWGDAFCTGTLITSNVVMTAAHCLPPNLQGMVSNYSEIDVFFGTYVDPYSGTFIDVVDGWTHPAWHDQATDDDIGLIRLAQAGPATPIPMNTQSIYSDTGEPVRLVGFGITSEGAPNSSGTKRQATTTIAEVHTNIFMMGMWPGGTCSGDSGGTALMQKGGQEVVAGIHSRSGWVSTSIDTRVDAYQDEINAFLGTVVEPTCAADGECAYGCAEPDPDCPCIQDGHCSTVCVEWWTDPDCNANCAQDGVCVNAGCPVPDPDCLGCEADGTCNTTCASDPDCMACPADGVCDRNCAGDPDCWVAGDASNRSYDGDHVGNCSVGARPPAGSSPTSGPWWWALSLGALLALRRRRTRAS